jgi:hypothetical protein
MPGLLIFAALKPKANAGRRFQQFRAAKIR